MEDARNVLNSAGAGELLVGEEFNEGKILLAYNSDAGKHVAIPLNTKQGKIMVKFQKNKKNALHEIGIGIDFVTYNIPSPSFPIRALGVASTGKTSKSMGAGFVFCRKDMFTTNLQGAAIVKAWMDPVETEKANQEELKDDEETQAIFKGHSEFMFMAKHQPNLLPPAAIQVSIVSGSTEFLGKLQDEGAIEGGDKDIRTIDLLFNGGDGNLNPGWTSAKMTPALKMDINAKGEWYMQGQTDVGLSLVKFITITPGSDNRKMWFLDIKSGTAVVVTGMADLRLKNLNANFQTVKKTLAEFGQDEKISGGSFFDLRAHNQQLAKKIEEIRAKSKKAQKKHKNDEKQRNFFDKIQNFQ